MKIEIRFFIPPLRGIKGGVNSVYYLNKGYVSICNVNLHAKKPASGF